jgi:hypothetical protein
MCFSEQISLAIGITGILSSFYFYQKKYLYASIGIGYFALMEILQFFQYRVINQCNNNYNKFLTNIGYIHICFQPLFINLWLFEFTKNPNFIFLYMSFFAGILLASRIIFVKDYELCDVNEPLCGKRTCSYSGKRHIAWNVRMRSTGKYWFKPSFGLHFFMWTIPALLSFQLKPILAMLLSMPYVPYILNGGIWSNIHEQASIWCYTEISQMLITYLLLK